MASATGAGFRLGIDFGTSHTTAILRWPDGHARPLLFDGSPLLASAIYAEPDGTLLVGRDAVHAARLDPARFEPSPKRRIDRDTVFLADQTVPVTAMIASVLSRVKDEAVRVSGARVEDLTLTHPAGWTGARLAKLTEASRQAGMPDPALVPEPVAAAGYFVSVLGRAIPSGSALVVYDFGGGTFDASAVTPAQDGYRVLAMAGLDNVGGVDLDAALLEFVATVHRGHDPAAWQRLEEPQTPADRRHRRHLIEDVRAAKEMLSRSPSATVPVPLLEMEARVSREEFDALARPLLDRTITTTTDLIRLANLPPERIAAVLLVGGSSRIPLVVDLLRQGTGLEPSTIEQPETVVAEGSIRLASGASGTTRAASAVPAAPVGVPAAPVGVPAAPVGVPAAPVGVPASGGVSLGLPVDPWATGERDPAMPPSQTVPLGPTHPLGATIPQPVVPPQWTPPPPPPGPPPVSRRGVLRPGRRRRRWGWVATLVVLVLLAAAGVALAQLRPDLFGRLGIGASSPASPTPYTRLSQPAWLPTSWTKIVDDEQDASVEPGEASNGGTCTYEGRGRLRVVRNAFDVSGCKAVQYIKDITISDVAVEAELAVRRGCAGMWVRTGIRGYFLAICRDGTVRLHELGTTPASDQNMLTKLSPGFDPNQVVVGLVARGSSFTIYVDGRAQPVANDPDIAAGRVGVGGFAPAPENTLDATIIQYRAWAPRDSGS
jgi:hypothetical protein